MIFDRILLTMCLLYLLAGCQSVQYVDPRPSLKKEDHYFHLPKELGGVNINGLMYDLERDGGKVALHGHMHSVTLTDNRVSLTGHAGRHEATVTMNHGLRDMDPGLTNVFFNYTYRF